MTQFAQLEMIYTQFVNLINEINIMIDNEEYDFAIQKLPQKDKLLKKLLNTKKTVNLTQEERQKIELIEQTIKEKETRTLNDLKKLQNEIAKEISSTKSKVKIGSAYALQAENDQGAIIDISE